MAGAAAAYFSTLEHVGAVEGWIGFVIEVIVGVAFGFLFHRSWSAWERARARLRAADDRTWRAPYRDARLGLLANLALLPLSVVVVVLLSAWALIPNNVWLNPGPIVIGMFLKSLLGSRGAAEHEKPATCPDGAHDGHAPSAPAAAHKVDRFLAWALIAAAIAMLLAHSLHRSEG